MGLPFGVKNVGPFVTLLTQSHHIPCERAIPGKWAYIVYRQNYFFELFQSTLSDRTHPPILLIRLFHSPVSVFSLPKNKTISASSPKKKKKKKREPPPKKKKKKKKKK